jgi:hypothetical protein
MAIRPVHLPALTAALALLAATAFTLGATTARGSTGDRSPEPVALTASAQAPGPLLLYVRRTMNPAPASEFTAAARCPAGYRAVGGGGRTSAPDTYMIASIRSPGDARQWFVSWETAGNGIQDPFLIAVHALCRRN